MGSTRRPEANLPANLLALCNEDHDWVESHRADAHRLGYLVSQHLYPSDVPVHHCGRWMRLHDSGEATPYRPESDGAA